MFIFYNPKDILEPKPATEMELCQMVGQRCVKQLFCSNVAKLLN